MVASSLTHFHQRRSVICAINVHINKVFSFIVKYFIKEMYFVYTLENVIYNKAIETLLVYCIKYLYTALGDSLIINSALQFGSYFTI